MHSWASWITLSSTEIWLANLVYWECVPCSNHCSQTDRRVCIWHEGDPHWSCTLREFAGAHFSPQIPSSSFGLCHGILEIGRFMVSFCLRCTPPFDLFISKASSASGNEQMIDRNKKGLASGVLIYVRRICGQFWLVLETRNVASGFLFWRHCGYEVFWIQIKYFIVSLPRNKNFWNVVHMLRLSKGSDCAFFQIFPMTLNDFAKFSGYISLYVLFLKNVSMNHFEIWPWALPN